MHLSRNDFRYELPSELIAQVPAAERTASRLLVLDPNTRSVVDRRFTDIVELLRPEDLVVLNDTRVVPARFFARKDSGGRAEILLERVLGAFEASCHVRVSKPLRPGRRLALAGEDVEIEVVGRCEDLYRLRFPVPVLDFLARWGEVPLPPYVARRPEASDVERYQTVYATAVGAVAAPTAGLHFDASLLEALRARGVAMARITLHVGAGTFQPVRVDDLSAHRMHRERLRVPAATVEAVTECRRRGGRVVAVGTTVVRALESAGSDGALVAFEGETDIFIHPPYRFRVVDALLTNFHLPESTLLMLVSAFAGRRFVLEAYAHAVAARYRFFSYGDAMFIERKATEDRDAL
jgi:S-adenosylmethionine:tRNA ribosyltransferase-isomerase